MTLLLEKKRTVPIATAGDTAARPASAPVMAELVVDVPTVAELAPPGIDAPWSLPTRHSRDEPEPEHWFAGPTVWGARPVEPRRVDGLTLLVVAAAVAMAPAVIAGTVFEVTGAPILGFLLAFVVGGGIAVWLDVRGPARTRPDFERGTIAREVYGLRGRFVGGSSMDALPAGTRVVIGENPSGEVCLYARGREYPLSRDDLDRVRAAMTGGDP